MRKLRYLIATLLLFGFTYQREYKLTEGQGQILYTALETAKKAIPYADNISAKEATNALIAIDSIQKVVYRQYTDSTRK